jgi:predicted dehydrogenase
MSKPILDPLPIGVVGLRFGRHIIENHLVPGREASPWFRLAAVCSQEPAVTQQMAKQYRVSAVHDLDELLRDESIPVVGLYTGPVGRAALIRRCIRAGKHVMTTKPLELDAQAAVEVLHEARRLGRVVHLNSPNPTPPPDLAQIHAWQREHDLGPALACRADVWASYRETPTGDWLDDPQQCPAAPLFRLGIYLLNDLASFFGEAHSVQVSHSRLYTRRPTADHAQMIVRYQSGALASLFASFCIDDNEPYKNALVLNFERGTVYRNAGPRVDAHGHLLQLVRGGQPPREVLTAHIAGHGSGSYHWDRFAAAIRGQDIGPVLSPEQMVEGVRIIDAMRRAQDSGRAEPVLR